MRKLKTFNLLLVLLAIWSSFSFAYDSATCGNLTSKNSFSATFNFTTTLGSNNEPLNSQTIFAERRSNDHQSIALWSNGSASALINDTVTKQPGTYTVWLTYDESNNNNGQNKQGQLSFYLFSAGTWVKKADTVTADFSGFKDIHIGVTGSNVNDLQCDLSLTKPEVVTEPPFKFDACKYFPQPIQSWVTEDTKNYSGYPESELRIGESSAYVTGWSDSYISDSRNIYTLKQNWGTKKSWNNLRVGFDKVSDSWISYQDPSASVCQGLGCFPDPVLYSDDGNIISRKAATPPLLDITFDDNSDSLKFDSGNFKQLCDGVICSYDDSGSEIYVTIHRDLKFLDGNNNSGKPIIFKIPENTKIELLTLGNNFGAYFIDSGNVYIGKVVTNGEGKNTSLSFRSGVILNIVGTNDLISNKTDYQNFDFQISNEIDFLYKDENDDEINFDNDKGFNIPVFYGPSARVHLKSKDILRAYILARLVDFDLPVTIQGSITANDLAINKGVNVIRDSSYDCWSGEDPNDEYKLELQPSSAYVLSCQTQQLELQVQDSDGNSTGDFSGTIEVSPSNYLTLADVDGNGTGNNGSYSPNSSGKLWLELSGSENKNETNIVSISATLNPKNNSSSKTGTYHFVPYKISVADQYVIANKPIEVIATVQGCNTDGSVVDIGYDGEPDVSSQWVRPASGAVGDLTYAPVFSGGESSDDLTLEDSGEMLVTLTDDNFTCSGDDCPIEGGTLQGQFTVYSRPWTFAICSPRGSAMDGNITTKTSLGFAAAGESFDLEVRPLRWVSGGKDGNPVNTFDKQTDPIINYCNNSYAITENFFASNSPESEVMLSYSLAAPAEAEGGKKGSLSGREATVNSDYTGETVLPFNGLKWSEVGVLRVKADAQYLGMDINQGYRDIGRFYPAYFEITQSDWSVDNQNDIAYLSQPYDLAEFAIVPYSLDGNAVENYSQFDLSLQAGISVLDDKDLGDRLTVSVSDGEWDNDSTYSRWYLEDQYAVFYRDFTLNTQGVRESSVDGPFNVSEDANSTTTNFGFTISTNSDPIDSRTQNDTTCLNSTEQYSSACDLSFPTQPPARYGRVAMDDVGGTSVSTINIPLRVEYWNGSRFITNTDDSASDYSSDEDYVCYQEVWSEASGSDGSLKAVTKTVDSGVSDELYATPYSADDSSSIRQQIRFWLRMDDTSTTSPQTLETDDVTCGSSYMSQPWLQYNWRGKGDEDPSSVVTFGIHRGNDRVIYRGEPGLTAQ